MNLLRYPMEMWPQVRGQVPFIVKGPNWHSRHSLRDFLMGVEAGLVEEFGPLGARNIVAQLMLETEMCVAAWRVSPEINIPEADRWGLAVEQCASEIPKPNAEWPLHLGAWEFLDGITTLEHYVSYLHHDSAELVAMRVPNP